MKDGTMVLRVIALLSILFVMFSVPVKAELDKDVACSKLMFRGEVGLPIDRVMGDIYIHFGRDNVSIDYVLEGRVLDKFMEYMPDLPVDVYSIFGDPHKIYVVNIKGSFFLILTWADCVGLSATPPPGYMEKVLKELGLWKVDA